MAGLNVDITADTRQFQAQVDDVPASLQKISDELNDVTKAGDKTGSSLESNLRKAQEASEQTQTVFREQTQTVTQGFRKQTEEAGLSNREVNKIQKETLQTGASTLSQVVQQTASSFNGTVEGALDAITNISTGLAVFGGAEVALAAGGVAILASVVSGLFGKSQEETKAFKADVSELTKELLSAGNVGHRSLSQIVSDLEDLATNTDESKASLSDLQRTADDLKVPLNDVVDAYERGGDALEDLTRKSKEARRAEDDRYSAAYQGGGRRQNTEDKYATSLGKDNDLLQAQIDKLKAAETAAELAAKAGLSDYALKDTLLKQIDSDYDDAAGDVQDYINKESGLFDVKAYIKAMQAKQKALADYQRDLVTSGLSPEAKSFLESQGADAAATLLAGYEKSSNADKTQLAQIWTTAGQASGGAYVDALSNTLPSTIKGPKIVPTIDLTSVQKSLRTIDNYPIVIKAKAKFGSNVL